MGGECRWFVTNFQITWLAAPSRAVTTWHVTWTLIDKQISNCNKPLYHLIFVLLIIQYTLPLPSTFLSIMAQLLHTPKSGSDWTANKLCAYNITVVPQNKQEFFGTI